MVKIWIKQLYIINSNSKIDFNDIILDILDDNLDKYDIKSLNWFKNLHRIRAWAYRLIFWKY